MLEIKNVSVSFSTTGKTQAVNDVSLLLEDHRKMALVGETGSGKSVLLQTILQLLPPTASVQGQIILDGKDLLDFPEKQMQKIRGAVIGYIPQGNAYSMNPLMKIGYQVGEPLMEHRGYSAADAIRQSVRLLKRFRLGNEENLAEEYPYVLSGGMRQRVMTAMGISAEPPILLADEPTKGLDSENVESVVSCFRELEKQAILFVTHDLHFAEEVSEDICVMYEGYQLEVSDTRRFFQEPLHPYSEALLNAQPERGLQCRSTFSRPDEKKQKQGCPFWTECPYYRNICDQLPPMTEVSDRKVRCWNYVA